MRRRKKLASIIMNTTLILTITCIRKFKNLTFIITRRRKRPYPSLKKLFLQFHLLLSLKMLKLSLPAKSSQCHQ